MAIDRLELANQVTWILDHPEAFESDNPWMPKLLAALTRIRGDGDDINFAELSEDDAIELTAFCYQVAADSGLGWSPGGGDDS